MMLDRVRADRVGGSPVGAEAPFDVVHSDSIRFFPELVEELGGNAENLFRRAHIDPSVLIKRSSVLEYRAFVHLLEIAAAELKCPDFGLRLAALQGGTRVMGPIGVVMKNSKTLGQALGYCAKQIQAYSLATRVRFAPDRSHHRLFVGLEIALERLCNHAQTVEHALLLANFNVTDITAGRARVRHVSFRHQPLSAASVYRAAFGCQVRFGEPSDGIVFTEQDLMCPVADPDERLYEMATSYISSHYPRVTPPMHARVRMLINRHLGAEDCNNEQIAKELCMHPRTLQRRLKCEGKSFEMIRDEVRREVALHYLHNSDIPFIQVAVKLGYADQSVLSRSCYRWFATSPRDLRERGTVARLNVLSRSEPGAMS